MILKKQKGKKKTGKLLFVEEYNLVYIEEIEFLKKKSPFAACNVITATDTDHQWMLKTIDEDCLASR